VSHEIAYLRSAIVDLRANLESILLNIAQFDECVERIGYDPDAIMVQEAARYIDSMRELHKAGSVLLHAVDTALAAVVSG